MEKTLRNSIFGLALVSAAGLGMSFVYGTINPKKWLEIEKTAQREEQLYERARINAIDCVDSGGAGLNFNELNDLYSKAGITFGLGEPAYNVDFKSGLAKLIPSTLIEVPRLTRQDLERVAESCEEER